MKRTYKTANYRESAEGLTVYLDAKPALTPAGNPLALPGLKLAAAVCEEWHAQEKEIKKETMPMTQLACIAIDLVGEKRDAIYKEILPYADTDLVCYRAGNIPALNERQNALFAPIIAWAAKRFGLELMITGEVMPVVQPASNQEKLEVVIDEYDDWKLAVLAAVTQPLGSIVLALAFVEREINAENAFMLAHLEEAYESEQWGSDGEKDDKMAKTKAEIVNAEKFLGLLQ